MEENLVNGPHNAGLQGIRFVVFVDLDDLDDSQTHDLDNSMFKMLSGGDTIRARDLYTIDNMKNKGSLNETGKE